MYLVKNGNPEKVSVLSTVSGPNTNENKWTSRGAIGIYIILAAAFIAIAYLLFRKKTLPY
jgi:hypothetical protein